MKRQLEVPTFANSFGTPGDFAVKIITTFTCAQFFAEKSKMLNQFENFSVAEQAALIFFKNQLEITSSLI